MEENTVKFPIACYGVNNHHCVSLDEYLKINTDSVMGLSSR